ncbi:hypothetical protein [Pseudomonas sp. Irchel 3H9]|uniref:hypothetical protein n=1 Tax=Pseudomonas sp. Irchel 3H9 TaxID=2009043 RepID=UPI000BA2DB74|nr:hypothetical protein [Pseudomonas sp. Irchel 3H9]
MSKLPVQPRFLRAYQAPSYLGMCRGVFDKAVRPYVREFPIGERGIGFDRNELDRWADAYIATHSIDKKANTESSRLLIGNSTRTPKTSEEFNRLVAEILGKPTVKEDRRKRAKKS